MSWGIVHNTRKLISGYMKNGRINNRLLGEIISGEKFAELMADAEVYMD